MSSVPSITLSDEALVGVGPHPMGVGQIAQLPRTVRLGCRVDRKKRPKARFAKYFDSALVTTPPPASTNYRAKAASALSRMLLNDRLGCCVISDRYHTVGLYTANDAGAAVMGTDEEVLSTYRIWNPGNQDEGCVITEVLDYHRDRGIRVAGNVNRIDGYVSLDHTNKLQTKAAVYLMPGVPLGIDLPQDWTRMAVWDVTSSPIVGGHDVPVIDYDDQGVYVASWGRVYLITWRAFMSTKWVGEAYVVLSSDWYGSDKIAPCGVDVVALKADMVIIKGGGTPSIDPPAPPPPPLPPPNPLPGMGISGGVNVNGVQVSFSGSFGAGQKTTTVTGTASRP